MNGPVGVVIVAAGESRRAGGDVPKQFVDLGGIPILEWSIRTLAGHPDVGQVVVVLPPSVLRDPPPWLDSHFLTLVEGGMSRRDSAARGVQGIREDTTSILVHDAARPFLSPDLIDRVLRACGDSGAVPGIPVRDTLKQIDGAQRVVWTVDRGPLRAAQTPQGFPAALLRRLHAAPTDGSPITDDAMLCEQAGEAVVVVPGDEANFKITTATDLRYARWLIETGVVEAPKPVPGLRTG